MPVAVRVAIAPMQVTMAHAAAVHVAVVMVVVMPMAVVVVMAVMVVMMAFVRGGNVRRPQQKRCRGGRGECCATYQS
jgi:uncharacterized membrane protein